ncbi:MAG TPA: RagB/SusD family nutrient uptake outer membrane protein [Chitinophagaceae bacterium]|nr:RagB/SusD family nutrient uptake outer membrane protein [Chitinophagaceae bacterium]
MQTIYKKFIGCMLAGALLTACNKTLNVEPYVSFSESTAFSSPQRVLLALNGVYDAAQSGFYQGNVVRGYPFGAANIAQGDMRGEDMLNQAQFYQVTYEANYNATTPNNGFMWQTLYALANKANLVIEGVRRAVANNVITAAVGMQYEAECRFLRAMAYHELVINFARPYADGNGDKLGIIYRDFGISSDESIAKAREQKRETVAQNYDKILADLDFAEANLTPRALPAPVTGTPDATPVNYRATKAAAIALKMRVKLHKRDWAGVIADGAKIVSSASPFVSPIGGWKLNATPDGVFVNNLTDESIFSIKNDANDNAGNNGALAYMLGNPALGGRGLVRISPIAFNFPAWRCDDKRRALMDQDGRSYYTTKYRDITNRTDAAPQIRYAEVLLMLAEAEARNSAGVSTRAIELLNAVRNRALQDPNTQQYTVASFATKNALIQAILNERRIEFLAEGKRWGDIHRLAVDPDFSTGGIPAKMTFANATFASYNCATNPALTKSILAIPYADFKFIWPVPLDEIQTNPNVQQNPGY